MRKTFIIVTALMVVSVSFAGIASARGHDRDWGGHTYRGHGPAMMPRGDAPLPAQIELTEAQRATLNKVMESSYKGTEAVRQQIITKQAELQAQLIAANPDAKKIETITRDLGELEGKMLAERVRISRQLKDAGLPDFYCNPGMGMGSGYGRGQYRHFGRHGMDARHNYMR